MASGRLSLPGSTWLDRREWRSWCCRMSLMGKCSRMMPQIYLKMFPVGMVYMHWILYWNMFQLCIRRKCSLNRFL